MLTFTPEEIEKYTNPANCKKAAGYCLLIRRGGAVLSKRQFLVKDLYYTVYTMEHPVFVMEFLGEFRLVKQSPNCMPLDVSHKGVAFEKAFPKVSCTYGSPGRFILKRLYTAFPEIHAIVHLRSGLINDKVLKYFEIETLLTLDDPLVRERAKEYYDQRQS